MINPQGHHCNSFFLIPLLCSIFKIGWSSEHQHLSSVATGNFNLSHCFLFLSACSSSLFLQEQQHVSGCYSVHQKQCLKCHPEPETWTLNSSFNSAKSLSYEAEDWVCLHPLMIWNTKHQQSAHLIFLAWIQLTSSPDPSFDLIFCQTLYKNYKWLLSVWTECKVFSQVELSALQRV